MLNNITAVILFENYYISFRIALNFVAIDNKSIIDQSGNGWEPYKPYAIVRNTLIAYRKTSNISRTFVGNKIVDNSDGVGASPVGAAPTTSSF